jgi:mono/diheme cytochrome c family protein
MRRLIRALALCVVPLAHAAEHGPDAHEAQLQRGERLYLTHCASCHGVGLTPDDPDIPGLTGQGFRRSWQGRTVQHLFERVRSTMPPRSPGALPPAETAAIVAHLLHQNGERGVREALATTAWMTLQMSNESIDFQKETR